MRNFHDAAYASAPLPAGLVEVVDSDNRPLCLMSLAEVRSQNLIHRGFALLARDRAGRFLTVQDGEAQPGFTLFAPCIPGFGYADSCEEHLRSRFGNLPASPDLLALWPPCKENFGSFTGICSLALSEAMLNSLASCMGGSLLADFSGLLALQKSSCGLSPFLGMVLESGLLGQHSLRNLG